DAGAITLGGVAIALDPALAAARSQRGAKLTGGIRPEALAIAPAGARDAVPARVEHVELLGHETLVHVRVGDVPLVLRTPGMTAVPPGAEGRLHVDPAALHLFRPVGARV